MRWGRTRLLAEAAGYGASMAERAIDRLLRCVHSRLRKEGVEAPDMKYRGEAQCEAQSAEYRHLCKRHARKLPHAPHHEGVHGVVRERRN